MRLHVHNSMLLCFWFGTDETSGIKCLALVAQQIGTLSVAMTMQQIMDCN